MATPPLPNDEEDDDVAHRRIVIYLILLYVGVCVGYLVCTDHDEDLRIELIDKLLDIAGFIAIGYCLGQLGNVAMGFFGGMKNAYTKRSTVTREVAVTGGTDSGDSGTVVSTSSGSENNPG